MRLFSTQHGQANNNENVKAPKYGLLRTTDDPLLPCYIQVFEIETLTMSYIERCAFLARYMTI